MIAVTPPGSTALAHVLSHSRRSISVNRETLKQ
jgi:hypothetical protein